MSEILDMSARELAEAVKSGELAAVEATRAYLDAIEKNDRQVRAYNEVLAEEAMRRAADIDSRRDAGEAPGALAGVPMALKDNLCTTFGRTTCSSKILENFRAPYNAAVVDKLLDAGAVVLGKANMDEFAMGSSTENSGFGPTHNPWDVSRVPGGSSGGSAAAVSARLCAAALGSDTGGSIRQPAAFCGVVGFKPTYGRVSRYGLVAYGSSLDQIGPITRDVADCALITRVIAGGDRRDSTSVPRDVPDYAAQLNRPIENLRVGMADEFIFSIPDDQVARTVRSAGEAFESAGAEVVRVSLPHSRIDNDDSGSMSSYAVACYYIVAMAEASSNLARYDGVHYGHRTKQKVGDIVELYSKTRAEGFGDEVKRRVMLGAYTLSAGYYDAYYNKALKVRRLIKNDFDAAFADCDVILAPVAPTAAFKIGEKSGDPLTMYLADVYTISANLAGLPGISVPAGLSTDGLPIGVQLLGPVFGEEELLRAAAMFERARGPIESKPPLIR